MKRLRVEESGHEESSASDSSPSLRESYSVVMTGQVVCRVMNASR